MRAPFRTHNNIYIDCSSVRAILASPSTSSSSSARISLYPSTIPHTIHRGMGREEGASQSASDIYSVHLRGPTGWRRITEVYRAQQKSLSRRYFTYARLCGRYICRWTGAIIMCPNPNPLLFEKALVLRWRCLLSAEDLFITTSCFY